MNDPVNVSDPLGLQTAFNSQAQSLALNDPKFWTKARQGVFSDNGTYFVIMKDTARMVPIVRTREELFSQTVMRESSVLRTQVVINGPYYDLTFAGRTDVAIGNDPVPPSETIVEGWIRSGGATLTGSSAPQMFHVVNLGASSGGPSRRYIFGFGDPPVASPGGNAGSSSAVGGVGPLIINGLPYGAHNRYSAGVPVGAPVSGQPPAAYLPFLEQRSNNTFRSVAALPDSVGRIILAHSSKQGMLALIVQPDGDPLSTSYATLRDTLVLQGFDNAVFLDGSDSVMLYVAGRFLVRQGDNKDESNTVGVGFIVN